MRNCRNYNWNHLFFFFFCLRCVFSIFYVGSFQVPPEKNHCHLKCQFPHKIPIWPKSLLYEHSEKWLSPTPHPQSPRGGGGCKLRRTHLNLQRIWNNWPRTQENLYQNRNHQNQQQEFLFIKMPICVGPHLSTPFSMCPLMQEGKNFVTLCIENTRNTQWQQHRTREKHNFIAKK